MKMKFTLCKIFETGNHGNTRLSLVENFNSRTAAQGLLIAY
jgi:hypothetical protein